MPGEAIYSGEDCTGVQVTPGCTLLRDRPFTTRTHMVVASTVQSLLRR